MSFHGTRGRLHPGQVTHLLHRETIIHSHIQVLFNRFTAKKYYFMSVKLFYLCHFFIDSTKDIGENYMFLWQSDDNRVLKDTISNGFVTKLPVECRYNLL